LIKDKKLKIKDNLAPLNLIYCMNSILTRLCDVGKNGCKDIMYSTIYDIQPTLKNRCVLCRQKEGGKFRVKNLIHLSMKFAKQNGLIGFGCDHLTKTRVGQCDFERLCKNCFAKHKISRAYLHVGLTDGMLLLKFHIPITFVKNVFDYCKSCKSFESNPKLFKKMILRTVGPKNFEELVLLKIFYYRYFYLIKTLFNYSRNPTS
jgi:hypothetical protein